MTSPHQARPPSSSLAEIVEITNEISELHFAESREIARILYDFSDWVRPFVQELLEGAKCIGELDFLIAKAQTSLDFVAGMPIISEENEMDLRKARHPLLERSLKKRRQGNRSADSETYPAEAHSAHLRT